MHKHVLRLEGDEIARAPNNTRAHTVPFAVAKLLPNGLKRCTLDITNQKAQVCHRFPKIFGRVTAVMC